MIKKSLVFIIILIILGIPSNVFANTSQQQIDLSVNPGGIFFDISNSKPGDKVERKITLLNKGQDSFAYLLSNRFLNGSDLFYNSLLLKITDGENNVLYNSKLKDFNELEARTLNKGQSEDLLFLIQVPSELGNEYQGLSTEFQFKFYVEGTLGGVLPVDNKLPTTGSEMFNLLATGAAILLAGLVLFTYVKRKKLDSKRP